MDSREPRTAQCEHVEVVAMNRGQGMQWLCRACRTPFGPTRDERERLQRTWDTLRESMTDNENAAVAAVLYMALPQPDLSPERRAHYRALAVERGWTRGDPGRRRGPAGNRA